MQKHPQGDRATDLGIKWGDNTICPGMRRDMKCGPGMGGGAGKYDLSLGRGTRNLLFMFIILNTL